MEDTTTGKIIAIGLVILLISGITGLLQAKGEGARRVKLVLGVLLALGLAAFVLAAAGFGGLTLAITAGIAIAWIARGFRG